MNASTNNENINILDLPNEMLLAILNKLNMTDVFYSCIICHLPAISDQYESEHKNTT